MLRLIIFALFVFSALPAYADETGNACASRAAAIHAGMTRREVLQLMDYDGGITGAYKGERLVFKLLDPSTAGNKYFMQPKACMLTLDFMPYGLNKHIFYDTALFTRWLQETKRPPDDRDTALAVSPPFLNNRHYD